MNTSNGQYVKKEGARQVVKGTKLLSNLAPSWLSKEGDRFGHCWVGMQGILWGLDTLMT
jgi:hypothetical protein